jgi:hypothetical protein
MGREVCFSSVRGHFQACLEGAGFAIKVLMLGARNTCANDSSWTLFGGHGRFLASRVRWEGKFETEKPNVREVGKLDIAAEGRRVLRV